MPAMCSIRMVDPDDLDILDRLQARLDGVRPRVRVVHDGSGIASFVAPEPERSLRQRVRDAIEFELGPAWTRHFHRLP